MFYLLFSCIQFISFGIFILYIYLSLISNARLRYVFSSKLVFQDRTAHLHQLHHQCSNVSHISHLTFILLQDYLINCMLDYSIVILLYSKLFLVAGSCLQSLVRPPLAYLVTIYPMALN